MNKLNLCISAHSINLTLNFNYTNGYVKYVVPREGQLVKNLIYSMNTVHMLEKYYSLAMTF